MKYFLLKYYPIVVLACLILIAFLLRARMYLYGDFYLLPDQGRDLQLVKQIIVEHKLPLIGGHAGFGGLFHGPLWIYMILPFFLLSGGNPLLSLIPVYLLVSLGIVCLSYFVGYKLYGKTAGFLFSFVTTFSDTLITTNAFTSNSQVMPLIFIIYLYCIILYLRGKTWYITMSIFLIGLGIHFESAFAIVLIPITILSLFLAKKRASIKQIGFGVISFFIAISNFLLFDLRHGFNMTRSLLVLVTGKIPSSEASYKYANIGYRMYDRFDWFVGLFKSLFFQDTSLVYISYSAVIIGMGIVIFRIIKSKKHKFTEFNKEYIFLLLILFVAYIFYVLYPLELMAHYIQSLVIIVMLLFVLSLVIIKNTWRLIGIIFICFYVLLQLQPAIQWLSASYIYASSYNPQSNGSYINQLRAVDYVYKDANKNPFGYFVYDTPIVTYGMDYLMWWRGKTKYNYTPESKKLPITYLIMSPPNSGDEGAHTYWMKNVVRTNGKVLSTKIVQGSIKILKLSIPPDDPQPDPNYYINLTFR